MKRRVSRRGFIRGTVAAGGAMAARGFFIGRAGAAANTKLNIACVGIGNMGSAAVQAAEAENLVALCDLDWRDDEAIWGKRNPSQHAAAHPQAKKFTDFREMLDAMGDGIDAVFVSTADHSHFTAAMAAMERGKHVFVQKPLAHNVWQVRTLQKAMHKYGVQTVMGNQGHCTEGIRLIKEWFDAGVLGEVREVHCWTDRPMAPWFIKPDSIPPKPAPVPEGLDYDLWQGPVAERPYCTEYLPQRWRAWWDYGTGVLGDIGCHCLDAPFWALRLGAPTAVDVQLSEPANDQFTPFGAHVTYEFPAREGLPPVTLHWYEGAPRPALLPGMDKLPTNGMYMVGSQETVYHEDMRPNSPMLWPRARMQRYADVLTRKPLPRVKGGPFEELIQAVKGEGPTPGSNFDYAAPLTELVLLGAIAIRTGQRLAWDGANMRIANHPEFNKYLKEPAREGWAYGEDLWEV